MSSTCSGIALQLGMDFGPRAAAAGQRSPLPPAKLKLVGASAQPSPDAGQHRRLLEHQRPALDPAAAGQPDAVGRDIGERR